MACIHTHTHRGRSHRERDRHRERQMQTQTDTHTHTHTEREREREREREGHTRTAPKFEAKLALQGRTRAVCKQGLLHRVEIRPEIAHACVRHISNTLGIYIYIHTYI